MSQDEITLDPTVEKTLRLAHDDLAQQGKLLSPEQLKSCYDLFRTRFGPEKLRSLDGEVLLEVMHTHGNKESLVYWLEFKNDEEFSESFGSIAGGSAHKFGLFRRKETGQWVSGSAQNETNITVPQAIEIARKHRDELLDGVAVLEKFPESGSDKDYLELQNKMDQAAPTVSRLAWGHKYFSLLFPTLLDDYHNHVYQRYHLIKLLLLPPVQEGHYICAGIFVKIARQLGWPMNHLTSALNKRDGNPTKYWRVGTRLSQTESIWSAMRDGNFVAIGWADLGDLTPANPDDDLKESLKLKLEPYYPGDAKTISRKAGEVRNFVQKILEGHVVLAADGQQILGVGRVTGEYYFDDSDGIGAPHRLPVEWLSLENWSLPQNEGKLTTVFQLQKYEENLVEIERHMLGQQTAGKPKVSIPTPPAPKVISSAANPKTFLLPGIPGRIQGILERKSQVIVYGPPGTGKTYWARKAACDLAAMSTFGKLFDDLTKDETIAVKGDANASGLVRVCTFHPAYGYEDFIEGYRPQQSKADQLVFKQRDGIFKAICRDAQKAPDRKFYLLIDEINRGDIPRIFGELLTLLEKDKRGMEVTLPVTGDRFSVPPNVFVLGTMNTADRSIALLDTALRRRFGFVQLMPEATVLAGHLVDGQIPLAAWLTALNERIRTHCGRDARNLQVGHAYFLEKEQPVVLFTRFARIILEDIIPLLEEYCYEDYSALRNILGTGLVDETRQCIREELFASDQKEKLVQALLAISPEMSTSLQAAKEVAVTPEPEDSGESDEAGQ
jgi:5-methylcytosine-specific restriction protein B